MHLNGSTTYMPAPERVADSDMHLLDTVKRQTGTARAEYVVKNPSFGRGRTVPPGPAKTPAKTRADSDMYAASSGSRTPHDEYCYDGFTLANTAVSYSFA